MTCTAKLAARGPCNNILLVSFLANVSQCFLGSRNAPSIINYFIARRHDVSLSLSLFPSLTCLLVASLLACLFACLLTWCLLVACLLTCLFACLLACLLFACFLLSFLLLACLYACLLACLFLGRLYDQNGWQENIFFCRGHKTPVWCQAQWNKHAFSSQLHVPTWVPHTTICLLILWCLHSLVAWLVVFVRRGHYQTTALAQLPVLLSRRTFSLRFPSLHTDFSQIL